ncbi:MAG: 23S rRNA (adenine(2503)-C(2))-methyltransferase RlmN, partial [Firmicutes bacterium]|nr:23S rRNA (adenine(2503)-C(2))-methyltransferase RlmN [Bacillota bacterium]
MQAEKVDIKSMLPSELETLLDGMGEPKYRAKQIFTWLSRGAASFDEMTDLPLGLRKKLAASCLLNMPVLLKRQVSGKDGAIKFLWGLYDGSAVETVFMRYGYGNTVCVSTQVGCRMGCAFCASTIGSLLRNLTPAEMLDELLCTEKEAGEPVSNV